MIPAKKVTDEATRTRWSSMDRPSNPVMFAAGPSSGTSRKTTEPIIRLKTGKGPAAGTGTGITEHLNRRRIDAKKVRGKKVETFGVLYRLRCVSRCPGRSRRLLGRRPRRVHTRVAGRQAGSRPDLPHNMINTFRYISCWYKQVL